MDGPESVLPASSQEDDLSTTGYCLANPGEEYLVFLPAAGSFTVDLEEGDYTYEWFDPRAAGGAGAVDAEDTVPRPASR